MFLWMVIRLDHFQESDFGADFTVNITRNRPRAIMWYGKDTPELLKLKAEYENKIKENSIIIWVCIMSDFYIARIKYGDE